MNSILKFLLSPDRRRLGKNILTAPLPYRYITLMYLLLLNPSGAVEVNWYTVDGGGGMSNAGDIRLIGVIGQTDTLRMSGGDYSLSGGYLPLPPEPQLLFKDSFE